jgi:hypothetical protein
MVPSPYNPKGRTGGTVFWHQLPRKKNIQEAVRVTKHSFLSFESNLYNVTNSPADKELRSPKNTNRTSVMCSIAQPTFYLNNVTYSHLIILDYGI